MLSILFCHSNTTYVRFSIPAFLYCTRFGAYTWYLIRRLNWASIQFRYIHISEVGVIAQTHNTPKVMTNRKLPLNDSLQKRLLVTVDIGIHSFICIKCGLGTVGKVCNAIEKKISEENFVWKLFLDFEVEIKFALFIPRFGLKTLISLNYIPHITWSFFSHTFLRNLTKTWYTSICISVDNVYFGVIVSKYSISFYLDASRFRI